MDVACQKGLVEDKPRCVTCKYRHRTSTEEYVGALRPVAAWGGCVPV